MKDDAVHLCGAGDIKSLRAFLMTGFSAPSWIVGCMIPRASLAPPDALLGRMNPRTEGRPGEAVVAR